MLPQALPTADVVVSAGEVSVTVSLPGLRDLGMLVELPPGADNAVQIRGVQHGEHADFLVPLPVAVTDHDIVTRLVNGVLDVRLQRAR